MKIKVVRVFLKKKIFFIDTQDSTLNSPLLLSLLSSPPLHCSVSLLSLSTPPPPPPPPAVVVVHWTRQIKEVLSSQESMDSMDNSGPLEEIGFWKERCEDLSGLTSQLNEPSMQRVVQIIDKAKSSYVAPFNKLARVIQVRRQDTKTLVVFVVCSHTYNIRI